MKNFIKALTFLFLMAIMFQACTSDESEEEITSSEQAISTDLVQKIITITDYINDYNFLVSKAAESSCEFPSMRCYFSNTQGDYYIFNTYAESLDEWLSTYNEVKLQAFNTAGVAFSNEDFFIDQMDLETGFFGMSTREEFMEYFESCYYGGFGVTVQYGVPFSEEYLNCIDSEMVLTLSGESINITGSQGQGLPAIQEFLQGVNANNNTNYNLEDITVFGVFYEDIYGDNENIIETEKLINYFDNCLISRDVTNNDCLNFVYPLEINRFNLELEEVITITIENDETLAETFDIDIGELGFVFPIELLGGNGSVVTIESKEELENALDNSSNYCN